MSVKFQGAVVFVRDIAVSRRFYEELLGQKILVDFGEVIGFEAGFSRWQADHAHNILFNKKFDEPQPLGRTNFELCFEDSEIQTIWKRISSEDIKLVHPLKEQPWGQLVFRLYDPDGHIVEIGEPIPTFVARFLSEGMTVEQVAKRTSVPVEAVQQISDSLK